MTDCQTLIAECRLLIVERVRTGGPFGTGQRAPANPNRVKQHSPRQRPGFRYEKEPRLPGTKLSPIKNLSFDLSSVAFRALAALAKEAAKEGADLSSNWRVRPEKEVPRDEVPITKKNRHAKWQLHQGSADL